MVLLAIFCYNLLYFAILCNTLLYLAILGYTWLYFAILGYHLLYFALLCLLKVIEVILIASGFTCNILLYFAEVCCILLCFAIIWSAKGDWGNFDRKWFYLQYFAVFCNILLYFAIFCYTLLYFAIPCYILLYFAIFGYTWLYWAIPGHHLQKLCYTLLYFALFCYILLYFEVWIHPIPILPEFKQNFDIRLPRFWYRTSPILISDFPPGTNWVLGSCDQKYHTFVQAERLSKVLSPHMVFNFSIIMSWEIQSVSFVNQHGLLSLVTNSMPLTCQILVGDSSFPDIILTCQYMR